MKRQRGVGLVEVSVAMLLVSMATLGLARSQLLAREQAEQARRHAAVVARAGNLLELQRAHSPALVTTALVGFQGLVSCHQETPAGHEISIVWPAHMEAAVVVPACDAAVPAGWQRLALVTALGEGW